MRVTSPRSRRLRACAAGSDGYALLTVTVFVLVILIAGAAIFALVSYESEGALHRQDSSEAFYLADGAVERARARFLEDRSWRSGWSNEPAGRGTYDLAITDTTFMGVDEVVHLLATGRVDGAHRSIEVMAELPPTAFGLSMLIMGDADVGGNLCLYGQGHINGGGGDIGAHLHCGGTFTDGFYITPPPIYTEPDSFPEGTYYYVRGAEIDGLYHARILNRDGIDITTALGDSLVDVISYNAGQEKFTYDFDSHSLIVHYFDNDTGVFSRAAGDLAAVVNFGEHPIILGGGGGGGEKGGGKGGKGGGGGGGPGAPLAPDAVSDVIMDGSAASVINATLINTRFVGVADSQRVDATFWVGGLTTVKQIVCEPYYGIALITNDFQKEGGSNAQVGTEEWPALLYVTQDVEFLNSYFVLVGTVVCLGDWTSAGGPNLIYDPGFMQNMPDYLEEGWGSGVSGTLSILRWREIASAID